MNLSGWNSRRLAVASASSRARAAVAPMSPVSMPARLTASSGRSKAVAMAASRSPSRRPMRSSPDRIFTTNLAVSGSHRASRSVRIAAFAAGPEAASIAANAAATSSSPGGSFRARCVPFERDRRSATATPRSEDRS